VKDALTDPRLAEWADHIERLQWSAAILDADWNLRWVSRELKGFVGTEDESELGYGLHIAEALLSDAWLRTVAADSQIEVFLDLAPYLAGDFRRRGRDVAEVLPEPFLALLDQVEPAEAPAVFSTSFLYVDPRGDIDLPPYRVNALCIRMHDHDDGVVGWLCLFFMGVRPNLLTLLARGDEHMYEQMARLVEPGPQQAAVLFCDLHRSGALARQLSTPAYFKLVRDLWTGIDAIVAQERGIVGKHAGDGASAFFLASDLGSPPAAAAASLRAARRIHETSHQVFGEAIHDACQMKIGLHWGANLYMGQLVPGGRLDVTALGDQVNETARIQECADPHQTLASKQLLERLTPEDAAALGLDLEKLRYRPLSEVATASDKAAEDAGGIPVTALQG
jgi:class 3 adenylate cyclase